MKNWRDVLRIHPACTMFDPLPPDELRALGEDIKKNGLTSPIVLWEAEKNAPRLLLDGRNRLDAIEMVLGLPEVSRWQVSAPGLTGGLVTTLAGHIDPYAYVISANIHRRHLTGEQKHELIAKLIETDPTKSNRQIAKTVKVDHKTVASVRAEKEGRGEIPHVETRTDSKGRKQPARKTTTKPPPVSAEVLQQREAAAERIRAMGRPKPAHDDIGADSGGEIKRLRERNEELENENACLRRENLALRSEIDELRARLPTVSPPADDGLDVPEFLRRTAP